MGSNVRIFRSDVIYQLREMFEEYMEEVKEQRRAENTDKVVFPVELEILKDHIYRTKKPIVLGCRVKRGSLRIGTPIVSKQLAGGRPAPVPIGTVESIEVEKKEQTVAKPGDEVCVRFESGSVGHVITYGRHFDHKNLLVSELSRGSLDKLKELYVDEIKDDRQMITLIHELKRYFDII